MITINPTKSGLVIGAVLGVWHALWAVLVGLGWAQAIINFVFWIHFIKPIYVIQPFNLGLALVLVVVTTTIGFFIGYVFAQVWNGFQRDSTRS